MVLVRVFKSVPSNQEERREPEEQVKLSFRYSLLQDPEVQGVTSGSPPPCPLKHSYLPPWDTMVFLLGLPPSILPPTPHHVSILHVF